MYQSFLNNKKKFSIDKFTSCIAHEAIDILEI